MRSILETIFIEIGNFAPKKGCEKQVGKNARPIGSGPSIVTSQGSLTAPLACALFQEETTVRAKASAIVARTRFFQKMLFDFDFIANFLKTC